MVMVNIAGAHFSGCMLNSMHPIKIQSPKIIMALVICTEYVC